MYHNEVAKVFLIFCQKFVHSSTGLVTKPSYEIHYTDNVAITGLRTLGLVLIKDFSKVHTIPCLPLRIILDPICNNLRFPDSF